MRRSRRSGGPPARRHVPAPRAEPPRRRGSCGRTCRATWRRSASRRSPRSRPTATPAAGELADDLRRFLDDEPIRARQGRAGASGPSSGRGGTRRWRDWPASAPSPWPPLLAFLLVYAQNEAQQLDIEPTQGEGEEGSRTRTAPRRAAARPSSAPSSTRRRSVGPRPTAPSPRRWRPSTPSRTSRRTTCGPRSRAGGPSCVEKLEAEQQREAAGRGWPTSSPSTTRSCLNATGATSQDVAVNRAKFRASAEKALAIYGIDLASAAEVPSLRGGSFGPRRRRLRPVEGRLLRAAPALGRGRERRAGQAGDARGEAAARRSRR